MPGDGFNRCVPCCFEYGSDFAVVGNCSITQELFERCFLHFAFHPSCREPVGARDCVFRWERLMMENKTIGILTTTPVARMGFTPM